LGLGQYVFPRMAVHIASGRTVPVERLRAHCLWYPAVSLDGREVSGHVLYFSQALEDALGVVLGLHATWDWNPAAEVENGEEDITFRLAAPVRASLHATVSQLIKAIVNHTAQTLPPSRRKQLGTIATLPQEKVLTALEEYLAQNKLHVLVPLYIGNLYQLFTDATEALLPVSPFSLRRTPRLCFVLLSTDSLTDKRTSPWLRQASELMALPVSIVFTPQVAEFLDALPPLRMVRSDPQLESELLWTLHELTGGWPDLCDRFFEMLAQLPDLEALRHKLWDLAQLLRAAERDLEASQRLLDQAFAGRSDLPDLMMPGQSSPAMAPLSASMLAGFGSSPLLPGGYEGLWSLLGQPVPFTWEEHGRAYLDGLVSWERKLAVPRSRAIELCLRRRFEALASRSSGAHAVVAQPADGHHRVEPPRLDSATVGAHPGPTTIRWLHVSDFHFSDKHQTQGAGIVLESLLNTIDDMRRAGRGLDCIFVTGDIAQSGSDSEYRLAEEYLLRLCEHSGVPTQNVIMVPGNHDVLRSRGLGLTRTLTSHDEAMHFFSPQAERWHLKKFDAFVQFYNRFYKAGHFGKEPPRQADPRLPTAAAEILRIRNLDVGLIPLNTAWFAQADDDSGKLLVGEPLLRAALSQVQKARLRIALMHHPVADLSEIERRPIEQLLQEHCHFVLRGHLHENEAQWVSSPYRQTLVMAAGAAYQGRVIYQNRAMLCEVEVDAPGKIARIRPYPIRYELTGHDRWTLDTSVFPKSYPTYLESLSLNL
jgi:predicted phosphodiesterase